MDSSKILRICVCIVHSVHCQSHKFRSWCPTFTRSRSPTRKWGLHIPGWKHH